ncbi:hypothetical protein EJ05DRAFT_489726 [Pseudovirgaria hyperparasitica]|uniref:Uncharacterized protein n=1 Tax=Pseudovirgaria hyperparasitica TaxID=470096 RepID=A0A6A6VV30_9PEZI|nr:uncharacterized protein EJ05DRAFT_489726 [Pseudovirgaria hyperparasitica]KAF2754025.1 hypothetical protein EJ05DRAFT_489726 [Pseudovirgaria hyperparasitica]
MSSRLYQVNDAHKTITSIPQKTRFQDTHQGLSKPPSPGADWDIELAEAYTGDSRRQMFRFEGVHGKFIGALSVHRMWYACIYPAGGLPRQHIALQMGGGIKSGLDVFEHGIDDYKCPSVLASDADPSSINTVGTPAHVPTTHTRHTRHDVQQLVSVRRRLLASWSGSLCCIFTNVVCGLCGVDGAFLDMDDGRWYWLGLDAVLPAPTT